MPRPRWARTSNIIRARKWLVIGMTLAIAALAAVIVNLMTPIYRATVTLMIESAKSKVISFEEMYGVPAGSREFFQTQAEFMKSREVGSGSSTRSRPVEQRALRSREIDARPRRDMASPGST